MHIEAKLLLVVLIPLIMAAGARYGVKQVQRRKERRVPGEEQRFWAILRWLFFICGGLLLIGGIGGLSSALSTPADQPNSENPVIMIVIIAAGLGVIATGIFFWGYRLRDTPEAITVYRPFFGTTVITHENLVSVQPKVSGNGRFLIMRVRDGEKTRRLKIEVRMFDLTDFFSADPRWESVLYALPQTSEDVQL